METYQELKQRQQKEVNDFQGIFFAFSDEQFEKGLKSVGVEENEAKEKIYSIGAGGYILKDRSKAFNDMFKLHATERKERKKEEKFLFNSLVYELRNHEYCITYDVTDALDALGYTKEEISPELLKKACKMAV